MDTAVFELIELPSGEIALKRADSDEKPLMKIQFSEESEIAILDVKMLVARAMVEAGIEAYSELNAAASDDPDEPDIIH